MKFWNFKNETEEAVNLDIEGNLIDDEGWMQWFYGEGLFDNNTPGGFRRQLKQYAGKTINVRVNSYGGDVFAGIGLYDALIEHKKTGGKVVTNGEKVFSSAVMPFLAGDERNMYPGGMLMVHNPLTEIYGNSDDLRKAAETLDRIKECILNIYEESTSISRDRLSELMDQETEMTAKEAVENGLATGVIKTGGIKNSAKPIKASAVMSAAKACRESLMNAVDLAGKAGRRMVMDTSMIKTLKDLREAFPELAEQAKNESGDSIKKAVDAERQRIISLEALDDGTNKAITDIVKEAKESGKTAEEITPYVNAIKKYDVKEPVEGKKENDFLDKAADDFKASMAKNVKAVPAKDEAGKDDKADDAKKIEDIIKKAWN